MRGTPLGEDGWAVRTAAALGLETTLRPQGRPRKHPGHETGGDEGLLID